MGIADAELTIISGLSRSNVGHFDTPIAVAGLQAKMATRSQKIFLILTLFVGNILQAQW